MFLQINKNNSKHCENKCHHWWYKQQWCGFDFTFFPPSWVLWWIYRQYCPCLSIMTRKRMADWRYRSTHSWHQTHTQRPLSLKKEFRGSLGNVSLCDRRPVWTWQRTDLYVLVSNSDLLNSRYSILLPSYVARYYKNTETDCFVVYSLQLIQLSFKSRKSLARHVECLET